VARREAVCLAGWLLQTAGVYTIVQQGDDLSCMAAGVAHAHFVTVLRPACQTVLQVVVPRTYEHFTSRRVLTSQWLEGEKLSQSQVGGLAAVAVAGRWVAVQERAGAYAAGSARSLSAGDTTLATQWVG
jgi:hypothetical protein